MAQQVTSNNSSLLDALTTSSQISYTDNSKVQFDAIYNDSLVKQKDVSTSKDISVLDSNVVASQKTTESQQPSQWVSNSSDTVAKNVSQKTDVVVRDKSNTIVKDSEDSCIDNEGVNISDEIDVSVEDDVNTLVSDVIDLVSKYTYFEVETDDIDQDLSVNTEDSEEENVVDDIDISMVLDAFKEEIDSNIEVANNTDTVIIDTSSTDNISNVYVDTNCQQQVDFNLKLDVDIDNTESKNDVQVCISESLNLDDIDIQSSTDNNKSLISQEMVDELNITIEEVSTTNIYKDTTQAPLLNTMDQVVKYSMEQSDKVLQSNAMESVMDDETDDTVVDINLDKENNLGTIESVEVSDEVVDSTVVSEEKIYVKEDKKTSSDNDTIQKEDKLFEKDIKQAETKVVDSTDKKSVEKTSVKTNNQNEYSEVEDVEVNYSQNEEMNQDKSSDDNYSENDENINRIKDDKKRAAITSDSQDDIFDLAIDENVDVSEIKMHSVEGSQHRTFITNVSSITSTTVSNQTYQGVNISKSDVISQIYNKLQTMNNNTKLTMVLNPESLGRVTIQLVNNKEGLVAQMFVQSQAVKEILEENIANLKNTLTAQGINVNDVAVKISESENNAEMDYTEQENSDSGAQDERRQHHQEKDKNKFEQMFSSSLEEQNENN